MGKYIETKLKYDKTLEYGTNKAVTESYLVEALTFSEAEKRIIEEMTPFITGEFSVEAVKKCSVSEIFNSDAEMFYTAKVAFITLDEKSGMEKTSMSTMLVRAKDFDDACKNLKEGMKGTMSDWKTVSLSESPIIEVYYDDTRAAED